MSRDCQALPENKFSLQMTKHVTKLNWITLLLRKVTDVMGYLGMSGDLGNNVNKCYPALIYNHKPPVLTHNRCRITTQSKRES